MERQRRINPKGDAKYHIENGKDKVGFDVEYISAYKGRGVFVTTSFQKGDFLLEYRGELISKEECERRQRVYHDKLKVFLFDFYFDGKLWCVDAAKEDGSLGRLVNDDHVCPNAKMKYLTVQGKPHLCLFAIREISQGEEVTYNYGDSDWPWRCKIRTEKRHSKVAANNVNQTDPDLEQLHRSAEMATEMSQSQMEENNLNQTDSVFDMFHCNAEVSPEAIQSQMPGNNLKQTDPNLISTNRLVSKISVMS
uniref:SET domain-containing protein n=2 Tax=Nothobranchius kadleci TaxID=1051664 RepID=A0A1A8C2E2_NOTKA